MSVLNVPHLRRKCSRCGQAFRAVAWSEYIGNILLGGGWALPILFGLAGKLPWVYAIGLAAIVVVLGVWLWPYVTIFEKVIAKGKGTENA
jgi:hypothetical protein